MDAPRESHAARFFVDAARGVVDLSKHPLAPPRPSYAVAPSGSSEATAARGEPDAGIQGRDGGASGAAAG